MIPREEFGLKTRLATQCSDQTRYFVSNFQRTHSLTWSSQVFTKYSFLQGPSQQRCCNGDARPFLVSHPSTLMCPLLSRFPVAIASFLPSAAKRRICRDAPATESTSSSSGVDQVRAVRQQPAIHVALHQLVQVAVDVLFNIIIMLCLPG